MLYYYPASQFSGQLNMASAESTKDNKFVKPIDFYSGNMASCWKAFKMQFKIFRIAKKYSAMEVEEQICNMLVQMGPDSVSIYDQFKFDETKDTEKKTLDNVIRMFDDYFEPVKNTIYERAKFNSMVQGDLSIHQFIVKLQSQAGYCEYGAMKDELIRDRIVVGVSDKKLRDYLIDLDDLDLNKCIQKAKQYVSHHQQAGQFDRVGADNLDMLAQRGAPQRAQNRNQLDRPPMSGNPSSGNPCVKCGKAVHRAGQCPATHTKCAVCKQKGHWAKSRLCQARSKAVGELGVSSQDGEGETEQLSAEASEHLEGLFLA